MRRLTIRFQIQNVRFVRNSLDGSLMVMGEAINMSGKPYNAVAFRMVLFARHMPLATVTFVINGFKTKQMKTFEVKAEGLEYNTALPQITRYEVYAESAY